MLSHRSSYCALNVSRYETGANHITSTNPHLTATGESIRTNAGHSLYSEVPAGCQALGAGERERCLVVSGMAHNTV